MNNGDIYNGILARMGKDQYGSYLTPLVYNQLAKKVNIDTLNGLIKEYEATREISRDLRPFIKTLGDSENAPLTFDAYGYADVPNDYFYFARGEFSDATNFCGGFKEKLRMVEFVEQSEWNARVTTELKKPTRKFPLMVRQNDKFLIRPILPFITFTYVKEALPAVFDYDIVNGVPVYLPVGSVHTNNSVAPTGTPSASVEFEFPDSMFSDLVERFVYELSVSIQNQLGIQTTTISQGANLP